MNNPFEDEVSRPLSALPATQLCFRRLWDKSHTKIFGDISVHIVIATSWAMFKILPRMNCFAMSGAVGDWSQFQSGGSNPQPPDRQLLVGKQGGDSLLVCVTLQSSHSSVLGPTLKEKVRIIQNVPSRSDSGAFCPSQARVVYFFSVRKIFNVMWWMRLRAKHETRRGGDSGFREHKRWFFKEKNSVLFPVPKKFAIICVWTFHLLQKIESWCVTNLSQAAFCFERGLKPSSRVTWFHVIS